MSFYTDEIMHEKRDKSLRDFINEIIDWVKFLKTKWIVICFCGFFCGSIAVLYAYFQKPVYKATLTFVLEDEKGGSTSGLSGLASQFGFDVGGTNAGGVFNGANLIELMKSRSLIEKTLLSTVKINNQETTLVEYYIKINDLRNSWQNNPKLMNVYFLPKANRETFSFLQDSILGVFYDNLRLATLSVAQKDKKVGIISIDVKATDQLFAKLFTETLANVVSDFYVETKSKKARLNFLILEKQTDSIRYELNASLSGAALASDNIYNLNPALNIKKVPTSRKQIDVQVNSAILTQLVQNLELAKVSLRRETPLIQIIDRPILPLPYEKPGKKRSLIIGGLLGSFLAMLFLIIKRWWRIVMYK
ncbi:MAG: Wzz/FepE/Etk N-terminal domain-containing protein [Sediminibacterium sp.]